MMTTGFEMVGGGDKGGRQRLWRISPFEEQSGLLIEYGLWDGALQMRFVPRQRCRRQDIVREAGHLVKKQMERGYRVVNDSVSAIAGRYVEFPRLKQVNQENTPFVAKLSIKLPQSDEQRRFASRLSGRLGFILNRMPEFIERYAYSSTILLRAFTRREGAMPLEVTDLHLWQRDLVIQQEHGSMGVAFGCLANEFRQNMWLTDQNGDSLSVRNFAARMAPNADEMLEQLGILTVIESSAPTELGTWFF